MSADLLRFILFIAGVGLILGIYFWERQKRINASVHAVRREFEQEEHSLFDDVEVVHEPPQAAVSEDIAEYETQTEAEIEDEVELELELKDVLPAEPPHVMQAGGEIEESRIADELEQLDELVAEEKETKTARGEQIPLFFAADEADIEPPPPPAPSKIVLINVKACNGLFPGEDVLKVATSIGLELGEMDIFHRVGSSATTRKRPPLFSMASMVEPGAFPKGSMEGFSTPGLALFLQLPSPGDDLALFNTMLATAESLAAQLGGELQDETHSVLTRQTIEHMREEIIEFQRQQRLAQKKS